MSFRNLVAAGATLAVMVGGACTAFADQPVRGAVPVRGPVAQAPQYGVDPTRRIEMLEQKLAQTQAQLAQAQSALVGVQVQLATLKAHQDVVDGKLAPLASVGSQLNSTTSDLTQTRIQLLSVTGDLAAFHKTFECHQHGYMFMQPHPDGSVGAQMETLMTKGPGHIWKTNAC